ncbi:putative pectate lyase [Helianthus annuus]|nr:putative pectate lyase [Helianthus annuus]KAJ0620247.1 putative pectate lyase [Helianthus annuus]
MNNHLLPLFITTLLVALASASSSNSRTSDIEELQNFNHSSMAARIKEIEMRNEKAVQDPEEVVAMVEMSTRNSTERRKLGYFSCGTLRHAVIQEEPLWIVFKRDMVIQLKQELIMNSFKTIDARGVNVHIANGACITIQFVTNIIIHGLHIHDCKPTGNALVRSSPSHYGWRTMADGDAISIFGSSHIWVDHNSLSNCADGLVDAVMGSTAITISNNYFTHHNEVILLGHSDTYFRDKLMQVTIAYNHFGEGLIQRMPRCRHGYFHVVNNDYTHWEMYAIGGSADPTINSQGNRYLAPANPFAKEVTKRVDADPRHWHGWNWRSEGDLLLNGAYFIPSGAGAAASYARASSLGAKSSSLVGVITSTAGVLNCRIGRRC